MCSNLTFLCHIKQVNALVLTIPFGMITDFSFEYWEQIEVLANGCSKESGITYPYVLTQFRNDFITIIYGSTMSLILILLYYVLRPRNNEALFMRWWRTGGNNILPVLCILTITVIVALLTLSSHLLKFNFVPAESFCHSPNVPYYQLGYGVLSILAAWGFWRLF